MNQLAAGIAARHFLTDGNAARTQERQRFAWIALTCVLLFGAMATPFFLGHVYVADDLGEYHLPVRNFYAEQLSQGEAFDWLPNLYSGFYLTGEGQAGTYHPLHLLLYWWLPLGAAFNLELLLSYPLMLAGTYFWLHSHLGRRDAALFGALVFTFSGFNLLHFVHPNAVAVVAHIPWLLWALQLAADETSGGRKARARAAVALLTGSQLLLGYPQYVWFSLLIEALFTLWYVRSRGLAPVVGIHLVEAKALGLLIGALQLLPTGDALMNSTRHSLDSQFANTGSLHPLNLIQFVAPYLFATRVVGQNTHELGLYAGSVPLVLCVWLAIHRRQTGHWRSLTWMALLVGGVGLLLAFGQFGGLYALQSLLPGVNRFRFPCRAIVLVHLAVAVGAAVAYLVLLNSANRQVHESCWPTRRLWCIPLVSALVAILGPVLWSTYTSSLWLIVVGPALSTLAVYLVLEVERGVRSATVAIVLLTGVDLACYGLSYSVVGRTDDLHRFALTADHPPAEPSARMITEISSADQPALRTGNRALLVGAKRIDGYAGLEPAKRLDYRQTAVLQLAGVHWIRVPQRPPVAAASANSSVWAPVPDPLPRTRLVTQVQLDHPGLEIDRFDLRTTALVEAPLELPSAQPGLATVLHDRPGRIELTTSCNSRQLLVISESFHRGWRATVDGKPCPVVRVNRDFLGCMVEAGNHRVRLEFKPWSLAAGKALSACGLGLMLCCWAFRWRKSVTARSIL